MTNPPLVLVLAADLDPQLALLDAIPHLAGNSAAAFAPGTREAAALLHWSGSRDLLRSVFLACPNLRWVHSRSAGLDNVLFPELVESAVPLTNGTGVFSRSLGEFALAAMLYFAKDFRRMVRNQQAARWEQFDVEEIAGQAVGVVGYGDIGRAVAARAHALGMRVLALKRHPPASPDPVIDRFYAPAEMAALLAQSDYVVVSTPLTAETRHMISGPEFAAMKPHAVLINIGRGPVVDQAALLRALTEKQIRGAALDVFEQEPIPAGDPIWSFENVLISPHCADHTKDWLDDAMRFFLKQYERFKINEPLENIVQKHLGY
ncbi:MAG: D-2-hydroxyacid dehydrogenase [Terracidiphilus sp.]